MFCWAGSYGLIANRLVGLLSSRSGGLDSKPPDWFAIKLSLRFDGKSPSRGSDFFDRKFLG
jgi:hypothetical protein